jgi:hypothetical protein
VGEAGDQAGAQTALPKSPSQHLSPHTSLHLCSYIFSPWDNTVLPHLPQSMAYGQPGGSSKALPLSIIM